MNLWEFSVAVEGWKRVHGADQADGPMSNSEFEQLAALLDEARAEEGRLRDSDGG